MDDVDLAVRKLKDALAVSEWHFHDAVEELMETFKRQGCGYESLYEED